MSRPVDGAQGGEPRESPRPATSSAESGLEHVERVLEPQHLMPLDRLVAVSLSNGCLCRRHTMARFDRPLDPSTRSGSRAESRDRLTALRDIEGLTTPRTVPSHVEGQLRYGSIKEGLTYHVLGVITTAGMT